MLKVDWNNRDKQIDELLAAGKEKEAAEIIDLYFGNSGHSQQIALLIHADSFRDERILFDLIVSVYTNDGYDFPKRLIQKAKKLSKGIPEEHRLKGLPEGNPVTVWRGSSVRLPDCGSYLRSSISWTTDKTCAIWFANRIGLLSPTGLKGKVWQATIERDKIIAFTQSRSESEVLQHMNVQNITMLDIQDDEWENALKIQEEGKKRIEQELFNN